MIHSVVQVLITNHIDELTRANRTDGQLLDLFVRQRDQEAFASLVHRHGPMVLGVCRRVLRNPADVDDAFQAAFLVLARKAAIIGTRDLLAQWLYGVAYNTARRLQRANSRRAIRERPLVEVPEPCVEGEPHLRAELIAILDEELNQLPERYRLPIVLCDLEGTTRKEAARMLRCPEGTIAGRLARARALLASRLTSRGVAPTSAILAAILTRRHAEAVSPVLVAGVVRAAGISRIANAAAMGLVSRRVASTTEGVLKAMFVKQLKTSAVAALLCGFVLAGVTGLFRTSATAGNEPTIPLADDTSSPKKPTPAVASNKKIVTVVPLKKLDSKVIAEKLTKLLPESITIAPVRDENAILVYATVAASEKVFQVLEALQKIQPEPDIGSLTIGEDGIRVVIPALGPLPLQLDFAIPLNQTPQNQKQLLDFSMGVFGKPPSSPEPKKFPFNMPKTSWDDVLKWYSETSGLGAINPVKPSGTVSFFQSSEKRFTLGEITDILNDAMMQQKLLLIRGAKFFTIVPTDEKIPVSVIPHIEFGELQNRGRTEFVEVDVPIPEKLTEPIEELVPELQKVLTPFGRVVFAKGKRLIVCDTAGNLKRIAELLQQGNLKRIADMLQQLDKPGVRDPKAPAPNAKKIPFRMVNVPWSDVLDWYAKESGLTASYTERPPGKFTFISPAGNEYTLTEITDIINEGLMKQNYLLIRKSHSFMLHPSDEKIDPTLAIRTKLDELKYRSNTELVEVVIQLPAKKKVLDSAKELHNLLSQFGTISVLENTNTLVVIDIAEQVRRIVQVITEVEVDGPRKKKEVEEKKFSLKMRDVPWSDVLNWYQEASGLIPVLTVKPTGKFTFLPPTPETQYTLGEITDILNESLVSQKLLLNRRQATFFICPADVKLDSSLVPRIELSELDLKGKTEVAQVLIPVTNLKATELAPGLQKILGPFGSISCLVKSNCLCVTDTVGNLRRVVKLIRELDVGDTGKKSPEE